MPEATGYHAHVYFGADTIQRQAHLHGMRGQFGVTKSFTGGSRTGWLRRADRR